MLNIGQKLIIPLVDDTTYVVKAGDTIFMGNNEYILIK